MKIAIVQVDTKWHDREANLARVESMVTSLAEPPDLVCLPEMFATGFTMDVGQVAEPPEGPTFSFLSRLARRHGVFVQGSMPQLAAEPHLGTEPQRGLNVCLVFDRDGTLLSRSTKVHPFTYGGEDQHYARGGLLSVFALADLKVATPVCYDLRFPELFRHATARGCEMFILPANWPAARVHHWRSLLVARAIENQAWVLGVNRSGRGDGIAYPGHSMVISPFGDILAEADEAEQVLCTDIDAQQVRHIRARFRFLEDARPDLFPDLFDVPTASMSETH